MTYDGAVWDQWSKSGLVGPMDHGIEIVGVQVLRDEEFLDRLWTQDRTSAVEERDEELCIVAARAPHSVSGRLSNGFEWQRQRLLLQDAVLIAIIRLDNVLAELERVEGRLGHSERSPDVLAVVLFQCRLVESSNLSNR